MEPWEMVARPILVLMWLTLVWLFSKVIVDPHEPKRFWRALEWVIVVEWASVVVLAGLAFGLFLRWR